MTTFTDTNFDTAAAAQPGLLLVDFWAEWCEPCKRLTPVLEALTRAHEDVTLVKLNAESFPTTLSRYGIQGLPAVLLFKDGQLYDYVFGAKPATEYDKMVTKAKGLRP